VRRVFLVLWPGLSGHYLERSLDAGHFPFLRALRSRGLWARFPAASPLTLGAQASQGTTLWVGEKLEWQSIQEAQPWKAPQGRLPRSLVELGWEGARARLFPRGLPEGSPRSQEAKLLAWDRDVGLRCHRAVLGREELRPDLVVLELPEATDLQARMLPLLEDCRPARGTLAGTLAGSLQGFEGAWDRVVSRLDHLVGRLVPSLDRDDAILVLSSSGQGHEEGFLLAYGRGFRAGDLQQVEAPEGGVADLVTWLQGGRLGGPPAWIQKAAHSRPHSPFRER
jgi:hypothetical protein